MACDDQYLGIPIPSSNIKWTGGTLKMIPDSELGCASKLDTVILKIDSSLDKQLSDFDMSKITTKAFTDNPDIMKFSDYNNAIGIWAENMMTRITNVENTSVSIGNAKLSLNMSCLVGPNCENKEVTIISVFEAMLSKICHQEADIKRLKEALLSDFDTQSIYVPQT